MAMVRPDLAMTGEISLRGLVLPVGGIKEKLIAAHRAGMRHILIPAKNEKDLRELPDSVRDELNVTLVRDVSEVLEYALTPIADAAEDASGDGGSGGKVDTPREETADIPTPAIMPFPPVPQAAGPIRVLRAGPPRGKRDSRAALLR